MVMWSGGLTSWAAARHVVAEHGAASTTLLFADTNAEDDDLYTFNEQASAQLGVPITRVADTQERDPWDVFVDKRWLGNARLAQCPLELKVKPSGGYSTRQGTHPARLPGMRCGSVQSRPTTQPPYYDKQRLRAEARTAGLLDPRLYRLGFAHNNCGGACVKGGQSQWARLLEVFPERYARAERAEAKMRALLGTDVSILRDLTVGDTRPLSLASKAAAAASPRTAPPHRRQRLTCTKGLLSVASFTIGITDGFDTVTWGTG
ncbi:hypothetical protein [Streptomyces sp. NPDC058371]|uniref:hypothetical protein n=1 Tax=Streptomyces sp. NPDC058371 TaxID=3346463 RepID=UPI003650AB9C